MKDKKIENLLGCFISALDKRRLNETNTPYLYSLINEYPSTTINTIPDTDLDPTILTGVYPHDHLMWQVKLKKRQDSSLLNKLIDNLPDLITTTAQCFLHLVTGHYDLAAIPRWRRRRFEIRKTRFKARNFENFSEFGGIDTIFKLVGEPDSKFTYVWKYKDLFPTLSNLLNKIYKFELFQIHSLDTIQHWNLDNTEKINKIYQAYDNFVYQLHNKCKSNGVILLVLADHGQQRVKSTINILKIINSLKIPKDQFTYYIEVPKARFFFHTEKAREKILESISQIENGTILSYKDLHKFNVKFECPSYGEYYFVADPGFILFPNDFYHPIGNFVVGLQDSQQRGRLSSPVYRGYHAYLPFNDSEKGFMLLLDKRFSSEKEEIEIIDVAPTILSLLDLNIPKYMKGSCKFN